MHGTIPICTALLLIAVPLHAQEVTAGESVASENLQARAVPVQKPGEAASGDGSKGKPGDKSLLGISILGNQEAPKALVIVPWKSSQLGDSLGISKSLDDARQPVDRDVFMRELAYYEIRESEP